MGDAKSIDSALLTPELLVISKKKVKTDEDKAILEPLLDRTLSEGAKTYLKMLAKEIMYGFEQELDVKYLRKGNACEQQAIDLLNSVLFKRYTKNTVRVETDMMTGECDILAPDCVRDIKNAWSLATFPCIQEDARDKDYEYQLRSYMYLYDRPTSYLDYCMVTTPEEMRIYEQASLHEVDHIDPRMRVTNVNYPRDLVIEEKIKTKCRVAQVYVEKIKLQILTERDI